MDDNDVERARISRFVDSNQTYWVKETLTNKAKNDQRSHTLGLTFQTLSYKPFETESHKILGYKKVFDKST